MAIINREGTAPIADGEVASGAEVEAEFNKLFNEINGNLDATNIASGANIAGSQLLDNSIANAKITADTLTTAKMAASAVAKGAIQTVTGVGAAMTTATSFEDVPLMTGVSVTPGSTNDLIVVDCTIGVRAGADTGNTFDNRWLFGLSINGTDTSDICQYSSFLDAVSVDSTVTFSWMATAPVATAMTVKPRYRKGTTSSSASASFSGPALIRVQVIPAK